MMKYPISSLTEIQLELLREKLQAEYMLTAPPPPVPANETDPAQAPDRN